MKTEEIKNIVQFLEDLNQNNNREWFEENRKTYLAVKSLFEKLTNEFIQEIGKFDKEILDLEAKKTIFRIHRDVRFSKNKTPYKTNFGTTMRSGGKHAPRAGYYFQLAASGQSFLGGGIYMPTSGDLAKIRQEIDYNLEEFKSIINNETFKSYFGEVQGEKLKTKPKGYEKDNPAIEFLRLKSFIVMIYLNENQLHSEDMTNFCISRFEAMKPFLDFLNKALTD